MRLVVPLDEIECEVVYSDSKTMGPCLEFDLMEVFKGHTSEALRLLADKIEDKVKR